MPVVTQLGSRILQSSNPKAAVEEEKYVLQARI
jgi:hypothetical protein